MKQKLQKTINQVIGKSGNLSVPSWWMSKILNDIITYCDESKSPDPITPPVETINPPVVIDIQALGEPSYTEGNATGFSKSQVESGLGMTMLELITKLKTASLVIKDGAESLCNPNFITDMSSQQNDEFENAWTYYYFMPDKKWVVVTISEIPHENLVLMIGYLDIESFIQTDWNASENELGYIKNRTHYSVQKQIEYGWRNPNHYYLYPSSYNSLIFFEQLKDNLIVTETIDLSKFKDSNYVFKYTTPNGMYNFELVINEGTSISLISSYDVELILNDINLREEQIVKIPEKFIPDVSVNWESIKNKPFGYNELDFVNNSPYLECKLDFYDPEKVRVYDKNINKYWNFEIYEQMATAWVRVSEGNLNEEVPVEYYPDNTIKIEYGFSEFASEILNYFSNCKIVTDKHVKKIDDVFLPDAQNMIEITYNELAELRTNNNLVPGMYYRIIDYITTTTQSNTRSANQPFDLILLATSVNSFSEQAHAICSERDVDNYFNRCDLGSWKIWYCFDNDTNRFGWADPENGKGVIYRMIDNWNNDLPYDFKNIQFKRYKLNAPEIQSSFDDIQKSIATFITPYIQNNEELVVYGGWDFDEKIWDWDKEVTSTVNEEFRWYYTFSIEYNYVGRDKDASMYEGIYNNYMDPFTSDFRSFLNNNVIMGEYCANNYFGARVINNTFSEGTYNNYRNVNGNIFLRSVHGNTINDLRNSFLSRYITSNIITNCGSIFLERDCVNNDINSVNNLVLGGGCSYNSFKNNINLDLPDGCYNNTFSSGVSNVLVKSNNTSGHIQYYIFTGGVNGEEDPYITINAEVNRQYETKVSKNSAGEIKQYCEADLIN